MDKRLQNLLDRMEVFIDPAGVRRSLWQNFQLSYDTYYGWRNERRTPTEMTVAGLEAKLERLEKETFKGKKVAKGERKKA